MFDEMDIIYSYSRAQAIEDGVLVDLTQAMEEGNMKFFKYPVAMTNEAYEQYVNWTDEDTETTGVHQDISGRLFDILFMATNSLTNIKEATDTIVFGFDYVPRIKTNIPSETGQLKMHIGPGDTPEPVITFMLPEQD